MKRRPLNCSRCGRFVGPDGYDDVIEVQWGLYEEGYPLCGRCLRREQREQEGKAKEVKS